MGKRTVTEHRLSWGAPAVKAGRGFCFDQFDSISVNTFLSHVAVLVQLNIPRSGVPSTYLLGLHAIVRVLQKER